MLLRVSDDFSFSTVPLSRKRKAVSDRPIHKWNKPSHTAGKPGRMILSVRPYTLGQTYKIILPCRWFARFHASGYVPFPFGVFPFLRISLLKFSCPICLHFRLPPFSRLSVSWKSHTNLTHPGKYFRPSKVKIMRPTSPK